MVEGHDFGVPFSKTCAMNDGAFRATGDVWVLLDADCYISCEVLLDAVRRIREARERGEKVWYVPYRRLCRLTRRATAELLESDPCDPWREPGDCDCDDDHGGYGDNVLAHHYMALVGVIPKEAWWTLGGFDPRFRSWGAEDIAASMAIDTLFGRHRTLNATVITPAHPTIGRLYHRKWTGGDREDQNGQLGLRYRKAWQNPAKMRNLVNEYRDYDVNLWDEEGGL